MAKGDGVSPSLLDMLLSFHHQIRPWVHAYHHVELPVSTETLLVSFLSPVLRVIPILGHRQADTPPRSRGSCSGESLQRHQKYRPDGDQEIPWLHSNTAFKTPRPSQRLCKACSTDMWQIYRPCARWRWSKRRGPPGAHATPYHTSVN